MHYYIRFPNAAVSMDGASFTQHLNTPKPAPKVTTLWALNAYAGRLGQYIAVQQRGDQHYIGVKVGATHRWVPAHQAITNAELRQWLPRAGFSR